eukprot:GHRR01030817.1.p1 GENE.GHRR01030817.1~~GHRR01030817.1.p1  ORF type:complete len:157 (-),score=43.60 GHRR01030817.1:368-838(-)
MSHMGAALIAACSFTVWHGACLWLLQTADFGPKTALRIVDGLREGLKTGTIKTANDLRTAIKQQVIMLLEPAASSTNSQSSELQLQGEPAVVLIVGVNGAGKTTTIGKLAYRLSKEGARVSAITDWLAMLPTAQPVFITYMNQKVVWSVVAGWDML